MSVEEKVERDLTVFFHLEDSECVNKLFTRYTKRELNLLISSFGLKKIPFSAPWSDMEHKLLYQMYEQNDPVAELKLSLLGRNLGMTRQEATRIGLVTGEPCSYSDRTWTYYELKELRENFKQRCNGVIPTLQSMGRSPISCIQKAYAEGFA